MAQGLKFVTPRSVEKALAEFDRLGREEFLRRHGFGPAKAYFVRHRGRLYDSKAIVGVARGYARPDLGPLPSGEFTGGEHSVRRRLLKLGFNVTETMPRGSAAPTGKQGARKALLVSLKSREEIRKHLKTWQAALLGAATTKRNGVHWIPSGKFWADLVRVGGDLPSVRLGTKADWERAAVEILLPSPASVGTTNALTTVATDGNKHFLLRQGFLRGYRPFGIKDIKCSDFARLTRATPVEVEIKETRTKRVWYVVCDLGASEADILTQTGRFVRLCADVRSRRWERVRVKRQSAGKKSTSGDVKTRVERRGTIVIGAQFARELDKRHSGVWEDLDAEARKRGVAPDKIDRGGYSIDMTLCRGSKRFLIEIKTGATANDIYTGIGQLQAYPMIFPDQLANHQPILLLPRKPPQALVPVLEKCSINVAVYTPGKRNAFGSLWKRFDD